ncbi:MAG: hypothetical protein ACC645_00470, partial [Pirellulales bacterium]
SVAGQTISVDLNTNANARTTARQLVDAINNDTAASQRVIATLPIGDPETDVTVVATPDTIFLSGANDRTIVPGYIGIGDDPNEVIVRFSETLPDDDYRLEVFGVATPASASTTFNTTDVQVKFVSKDPGVLGNGTLVQITKSDKGASGGVDLTPPTAGNGFVIAIDLNSNSSSPSSAANVRHAIANDPLIDALLSVEITGNQNSDIATPATDPTDLALGGGFRLPLSNILGDPFNAGADLARDFELDLAPQVVSVVPQPIDRDTKPLVQRKDEIVVYFNEDELDPASAANRAFYKVIDTKATLDPTDDVITLPESVTYDYVNNVATLTFSAPLTEGTHRLTIGTSDEPNDTIATAVNLGTLFEFNDDYNTVAYVGDTASGPADVDLYGVELLPGARVDVEVDPESLLDTQIELLNDTGGTLEMANTGAAGSLDTLTYTSSATASQQVFVRVSRNGAATTGSYVLKIRVNRPVLSGTSTLVKPVATGATTVHVDDATRFPSATPFTIRIGDEQVRVTGVDATTDTLTVERGLRGTATRRDEPMNTTALAADVLAADSMINVKDAFGFPVAPFVIRVADEEMRVTSLNLGTNVLTVERAFDGTTAATNYSTGDEVVLVSDYLVNTTSLTAAGIADNLQTTFAVTGASGFPGAPFVIRVGAEQMRVTSVDVGGGMLTVERGFGNTEAAAHPGTTVHGGMTPVELAIDYFATATDLAANVALDDGEISVVDASRLPAAPFMVTVGSEQMRVVSVFDNTLHVERGVGNTTPAVHDISGGAIPVALTVEWLSDDNSSFDTAVDLGNLGVAEKSLSSEIEEQGAFTNLPAFPGGNDEPGHRQIAPDDHIGPIPPGFETSDFGGFPDGFRLSDSSDAEDLHDGVNRGNIFDNDPSIRVIDYNFQDIYGQDIQGNDLHNTITENQKQRTREIVELFSRYTGLEFRETPSSGITVVTGDMRAINESTPVGPGAPFGKAGRTNVGLLAAIVDSNEIDHGSSEYGGKWFRTAFQMIGHTLGLGNAYDLPSIMGDLEANTVPGGVGLSGRPIEPVFPGDQDLVHVNRLHRPDSTDVDVFKFELVESGFFSAETIAERRDRSSLLNTALLLYREETTIQFLGGGDALTDSDYVEISDGINTVRFEFDDEVDPGNVTTGSVRVPFSSGSTATDLVDELADKINDSNLNMAASGAADRILLSGLSKVTDESSGFAGNVQIDGVRDVFSQNDDYFGSDSFIGLELEAGTYYIGVSSTGNTAYDPAVSDSGGGGTTDGHYDLVVRFEPSPKTRLVDKAPAFEFLAGGSVIADGEFIDIKDGTTTKRFEFDLDSPPNVTVNPNVVAVPFSVTSTPSDLARALADAINGTAGFNTTAVASGLRVRLSGAPTLTPLDASGPVSSGINLGQELRISESLDASLGTVDGLSLDGDSDGLPGGQFDFWFQVGSTIFVDKTSDATSPTGAIDEPFREIDDAIQAARFRIVIPGDAPGSINEGDTFTIDDGVNPAITFTFTASPVLASDINIFGAANADDVATTIAAAITGQTSLNVTPTSIGRRVTLTPTNPDLTQLDLAGTEALLKTPNIIRIVGNADVTGAPGDAQPYLLGLDDFDRTLEDGSTFKVPQGVTVMIDEGTLFKLQDVVFDAGTSSPTADRRGGAIQILGTPESSVFFRSFHDDSVGGDSDNVGPSMMPGDWGGVVFRDDSDFEQEAIFLNWVNHADMSNGGGKVVVDSIESLFTPIHLETARPTISHNLITNSAAAALSADPNSFEDTLQRVGPDLHGNRLLDNSVNGLFIRIDTQAGVPLDKLEVSARWDDRDVVHVVTENLQIVGAPGGPEITNEVHQISLVGAPNMDPGDPQNPAVSDTFTLTFDGQTTLPIAANAPNNINTNEVQRLTIPGNANRGEFTLTFVRNEVQQLSLPLAATSGTFQLRFQSFGGAISTSVPLPYNATGVEVQAALQGMTNIGAGNVSVTGGPLPHAINIEFQGALAQSNVSPLLVVSNNLARGNEAVDVTVTGSFQTSINARTILTLPFNATAAQVRAALENTFAIEPGDVLVTGGPLPARPIDIEFRGRFAGADLPGIMVTNGDFFGSNPVRIGSTNVTPVIEDGFRPVIVSVRNRLEDLFNINISERGEITASHLPAEVVVTGGPLPAVPVNVEFVGRYTGRDVPLLHLDPAALPQVADGATSMLAMPSGATVSTAVIQSSAITARPAARLQVDPGLVIKLDTARIETEVGSGQFIAEGTSQRRIIFTSRKDDTYGAGGTFDTTSDLDGSAPAPGQWGGLIFNAGTSASIDRTLITHGGGRLPIEGDFDQFNAVEVHQARLRLTNSILEENASGLSTGARNGRGENREAVVFVRGAQPIIVDNIFRNNTEEGTILRNWTPVGTHMISINANALTSTIQADYGRTTGRIDLVKDPTSNAPAFTDNRGPLIRRNLVDNNGINGMEVRGEELTTESVWDDTDIVHVLRDEIVVLNHHTFSGLSLRSGSSESLVVKLAGNPNDPSNVDGSRTGFTANGTPLDIDDRIGGTVTVQGFGDFHVILTSLADDDYGASFSVDGLPHSDTNNDGDGTSPRAGDWRGILLEKYSNDRNVTVVTEVEPSFTDGVDQNLSPVNAEFLGELAPGEKSGDENRALGFTVEGFIAVDDPTDVDVFSFKAVPGTEVWLDVDRTAASLDAVVELIAENGSLLARSIDNQTLTSSPTVTARNMIRDDRLGGDFYSTNPRDPGMRLVLPGSGTTPGTYFVRVRSNPSPDAIDDTDGGLTRGEYRLQIRLRQEDEKGGSSIRFADILYADTGIHARGLPAHSPLIGEAAEANNTTNNTRNGAQVIGDLLATDRNTISFAGQIETATNGADVDWFEFTVDFDNIQAIPGVNNSGRSFPVVFDLDYADQLNRPDAGIAVFDAGGRLVLVGRDSDVIDDQPLEGQNNSFDDLTRASLGKLDPYIGPVQLPAEVPGGGVKTYYLAVFSNLRVPDPLDQFFRADSTHPLTRLEPVNSVQRVVEEHISLESGYTTGSDLVGTEPQGPRRIEPDDPGLFDITSSISLGAYVVPWTLNDMTLYATTTSTLFAINPFNGDFLYTQQRNHSTGTYSASGLVMRNDGRLFVYRDDVIGNTDGRAGNVLEIDLGTTPGSFGGNDGIPNTDCGVNTTRVGGIAADLDTNNVRNFVYAVHDLGNNVSRLYRTSNDVVTVPPVDRGCGFQGVLTGPGVTGLTTGIVTDHFGQLYGVSEDGQFFQVGGGFGGIATLIRDYSSVLSAGEQFTDVTIGPPNLENGAYRNVFFATTNFGRMYAFTDNGTLVNVFDADDDGTADNYVVRIPGSFTGLAFSPIDYNLWHPTMRRDSFPGHGINTAFDDSRDVNSNSQTIAAPFPTWSQPEENGGASFYFGIEQYDNVARSTTGSAQDTGNYLRYDTSVEQYGELGGLGYRHQRQLTLFNDTIGDDTSTNGVIESNYNVPGGAHGALETNSFSLDGYERTDKPTLYMNYFLDTENGSGTTGNRRMVDSARVFISRDDGASWEQLATNNSILTARNSPTNPNAELPTFLSASRDAYPAAPNQRVQELFDVGSWRQARVDLADFAGEPDLKLRFDFSTAGVMTFDLSHPGDLTGEGFVDGQIPANRTQNNDAEGFFIDDIIIGFAERGEMVTGNGGQRADNGFTQVPQNPVFGAPVESLVGPYQVEIRRGTEYIGNDVTKFDWNDPGNPVWVGEPLSPINGTTGADETKILTTFDTNERFARSFTIVASTGPAVNDTELLRISDGVVTTTFEFDSNNLAPTGDVPIRFTGNETSDEMAIKIRDAINGVANLLVTADTLTTSHRVKLVGASTVEFVTTPRRLTLATAGGVTTIDEDDATPGTVQATVTRTGGIQSDLTVTLTSSDVAFGARFQDGGGLVDTLLVTILAGSDTSAPFTIEAVSDTTADRHTTTFITAAANGFDSVALPIDVTDDETAQFFVDMVAPDPVLEDAGSGAVTATIRRNTRTETHQYFDVETLDTSELVITNGSAFAAENIDVRDWTTAVNPNVHDFVNIFGTNLQPGTLTPNSNTPIPSRPHTTINAVGDGSVDFYSFFVDATGRRAVFDIDNGFGGTGSVDTALFLWGFDENANDFELLASNDNVTGILPEGTSATFQRDPFIEYTFSARGYYVIEVAGAAGSIGDPTGTGDTPINAGQSYTLQVALEGHNTNNSFEPGGSVMRGLMIAGNVGDPGVDTIDVSLTPVQDFIVDGNITTNVAVTAPFFAYGVGSVTVQDAASALSLGLTLPAIIFESGGGTTGTVTLSNSIGSDLVVSLVSGDTSEVLVPSQVTIQGGQTSATFSLTPVVDIHQDGPQPVNIFAVADGFPSDTDALTVNDAGGDALQTRIDAQVGMNFQTVVQAATGLPQQRDM